MTDLSDSGDSDSLKVRLGVGSSTVLPGTVPVTPQNQSLKSNKAPTAAKAKPKAKASLTASPNIGNTVVTPTTIGRLSCSHLPSSSQVSYLPNSEVTASPAAVPGLGNRSIGDSAASRGDQKLVAGNMWLDVFRHDKIFVPGNWASFEIDPA